MTREELEIYLSNYEQRNSVEFFEVNGKRSFDIMKDKLKTEKVVIFLIADLCDRPQHINCSRHYKYALEINPSEINNDALQLELDKANSEFIKSVNETELRRINSRQ